MLFILLGRNLTWTVCFGWSVLDRFEINILLCDYTASIWCEHNCRQMHKSTGFESCLWPLQLSTAEKIIPVYKLQKWKGKDAKEQAVKSKAQIKTPFQKAARYFCPALLLCWCPSAGCAPMEGPVTCHP